MQKLKALWCSLPHAVQTALVIFASAFLASWAHAAEDAGLLNCATWPCFIAAAKLVFSPHMILTAAVAGGVALKVYLMVPKPKAEQLKAQGAAEAMLGQQSVVAPAQPRC